MNDYRQLAAQFQTVRRAWKRAAALSGAAIVLTESIGILTVLLFLDWLYQPQPMVRMALWSVALISIAFFFVRHVVAPLVRKIPDEQIALYIEEHRTELDGVLITAAEYGPRQDRPAGNQAGLIDAVVAEAAARSQRLATRRVVDLSRLKKYGLGAAAGVGVFVLLSVLFPNTVGLRIGRVLQPWRTTTVDLAKRPGTEVLLRPMEFALSKGDVNLPRGASLDLEVTLSRPAEKPVDLNFRPRTEGAAWQKLPMAEIEKLNGFKGTLADVSEDLEFFVTCGADKSATHKLMVFDPLVVREIAVTTHYPDYVKLPDRVERPSNGDVAALIGSKVTVRILGSGPLKDGQLKWSTGQTQSFVPDPQTNAAMLATFEVKEDAGYDFTIADANGQQAGSAATLTVRAVPDNPPTLRVLSPAGAVLTHRLGEVNFEVEAADDFGVVSAELVCFRLDNQDQSHETRVPLVLQPGDTNGAPNTIHSSYRLALEDAQPLFNPEDVISYHVEARDAKGQQAISEIGLIRVGFFESWATWGAPKPGRAGAGLPGVGPDLMAILEKTWHLDNQKTTLAPADFQQQSKDIAGQMVDPTTGQMLDFCDIVMYPQLARVAGRVAVRVKNAHNALSVADTVVGALELRIAVAIYNSGMMLEDLNPLTMAGQTPPPGGATGSAAAAATSQATIMKLLEQVRLEALNKAAADKARNEKDKAASKVNAQVQKTAEDLIKKQEAIIAKAKNQDQSSKDNAAGAKTQPSGAASPLDKFGKPASAKPPSEVVTAQRDVADKTKAAADQAKSSAATTSQGSKLSKAAEKLSDAAKTMQDAARAFEAGKHGEGEVKANQAKSQLQEARDTLRDTNRDKLQETITRIERHAAELLAKQESVRGDTEVLAKELASNTSTNKAPNVRQQRDLQVQAYQENELRSGTETLITEVDELNTLAALVDEPATVRALAEAQRALRRGQPEVKMANAIVELNNTSPGTAVDEQKKAEDGLGKTLEQLRTGGDALASTRDAQVKRAARAAEEVKQGLDQMAKAGEKSGQPSGDKAGSKPGDQASGKPGDKSGQPSGDKAGSKPGDQVSGKPGDKSGQPSGDKAGGKPGDQASGKPGDKSGQPSGDKAGSKPGDQASGKPGDKSGQPSGDKAGSKPGDQASGKPGDKSGQPSGDKAGGKPGDQASGKPGDKSGQPSGDKAGSKPGDQASGKPGDKSGQPSGDKAGGKPGDQASGKPGDKSGQPSGDKAGSKPGDQASGKPGDQTGGDTSGSAQAQASQQGSDMTGSKPGQQGGGDNAQPSGSSKGTALSQKLAYDIKQLTRALDNRGLVPQSQVDWLKGVIGNAEDGAKKIVVDEKTLKDVAEIIARISNKLEAEMEAKTEAKKLFASQREECPPSYRQLVNKYFEALAEVSRPAEERVNP
jgi:hypothetical protein